MANYDPTNVLAVIQNAQSYEANTPPAQKSDDIVAQAKRQGGWVQFQDGGAQAPYDPRSHRNDDGTWTWQDGHKMGFAVAAIDRPEHGFAGAAQVIGSSIPKSAEAAVALIALAPLAPFALAAAEIGGGVVAATGNTKSVAQTTAQTFSDPRKVANAAVSGGAALYNAEDQLLALAGIENPLDKYINKGVPPSAGVTKKKVQNPAGGGTAGVGSKLVFGSGNTKLYLVAGAVVAVALVIALGAKS